MKKTILYVIFTAVMFSGMLAAQESYKLPPPEVVRIVDAPPIPQANLSPSGTYLMLLDYQSMPSIDYLSQPLLRLAGIRIIPAENSLQRTTFYTGITLKNLIDGSTTPLDLPEGARLGVPRWSDDESLLAFPLYTDTGVQLWIADIANGSVRCISDVQLNLTIGPGFIWVPGERTMLASLVPADRGVPPAPPRIPGGPVVRETTGKVSKVRTYQDLLSDPYDEALFDYYCTSQLVEISIDHGGVRPLGTPDLYRSAEYSPDGNFLMVERVKRPYSYSVPYYSFAHSIEIWDRKGKLVHQLADLPLADQVPIRGVSTGPRSVAWRPFNEATLVWVEALDGGDPEQEVEFRDRIMTLSFPFSEEPREILRLANRFAGMDWLVKKGLVLISERNWKKNWRTTSLVDVDQKAIHPEVIFDLSTEDAYNDPGRPVIGRSEKGERLVLYDKGDIYLSGRGSSPRGDHPFLDRFNLKKKKAGRLFQSAVDKYETFAGFVGGSRSRIIISSESKTEVPNYFMLHLNKGSRQKLTDFQDPAPQLTGMKKELITYTRNDGVPLSGTLYLPADYRKGERLPLVLWAYPREYTNPKVAGQVRGSPNRFTFFRGYSHLFFITQGYAVLDGAQMPVVGDPETMNNTFVEQIVASAKAAIDKLDEMGIIDPARVGVGGHSYGAFMTANLLAHCDLFAAGIARSGAYNRTLTPFGFQSERRTFWEAPEIYFRVSPFMYADKVNEPILLIHGMADNNSGTFPIQSERFFHALKGHGATARLVMLPCESHGYRARESVLDVLAEMFDWFDRYVKNRK